MQDATKSAEKEKQAIEKMELAENDRKTLQDKNSALQSQIIEHQTKFQDAKLKSEKAGQTITELEKQLDSLRRPVALIIK